MMRDHEEDAGFVAQRAAEAHLAACQEAFWAGEDPDGPYWEPDWETAAMNSPASAPFDGCDTCIVREVLHAAWPIIEDHVRKELAAR